MSAQNINPPQSRHDTSKLHKLSQVRSVAAIFPDHNLATQALDCLIKEGFNLLQIDIKPTITPINGSEIVVVRATHRAITALEILVNIGGNTKVNQTEWLAENA